MTGLLRRPVLLVALAETASLLTGWVLAVAFVDSPWMLPVVPLGVLGALLALRSPLAALSTAVLLAPLGLRHLVGPLKVAQALDVVVLLCLAVANVSRGRAPLAVPRPLVWGGALVAVALVSSGTAADGGLALKQDTALVVGLGLCAAVATICARRPGWLTVVRSLLVGSLLVTIPALSGAGSLQAQYGGSVVNDRPQGVFAQPNELGAFAMLTALVALGLLLGSGPGRDRWLGAAAALGSTGAMLVSLSRGAWIGYVLGVVCLLVWVPRARTLLASSAAVVLVIGALLGAFSPDAPQVQVISSRVGSLTHAQANPYDARPRIWREAIREFTSRPVVGHGPGTFPVVSTRSISSAATVQAEHAHDVVLTAAAETGALGVLALLGLTVSTAGVVRRGIRRARSGRDQQALAVLAGLGASLAGLIGEGTVDVTLRNVVVVQTVWVVLGLALAGAALTRGRPQAVATAARAGVADPSARTSPKPPLKPGSMPTRSSYQ